VPLSVGYRDPDVPESERFDRAGVDERGLEHRGRDPAEAAVQQRRLLEDSLLEPRRDLAPQRLEPVQAEVLGLPLLAERVERLGRLAVAGRCERTPLVVEPVEGCLVREIPALLVEDERPAGTQQQDNVVERVPQVSDVMERVRRDHGIELLVRRVEILEADSAEEIALRRTRVDPEHVVAVHRERGRQLAVAAADVEETSRRHGEVLADEVEKRRLRHVPTLHPASLHRGSVKVTPEEARRIAVRAQLLDGSATDVLSTVRRLGFLQIDVVRPVERPQHLVLFSRLGPSYHRAELDRLLWEEKALFEWDAFIYPIEELPLVRARIRRFRRSRRTKGERWVHEFLTENRAFKRYVLRELEQNGPMLSRSLEDRSKGERERHRWWGARKVGLMLLALHVYGEITVVGRRGGERLWDLAGRWWPETETISIRDADRIREERRFRTQGVKLVRGEWVAHPDAVDGEVPDRAVLLSPFDRLVYDRNRAEALWGFHYRLEMFVPKAKREYGYYVLPLLVGSEVVGRAEPRFDRATGTLELLGAWGDTSRLGEALDDLGTWLGCTTPVAVPAKSA
jgi:uncharacterized protein